MRPSTSTLVASVMRAMSGATSAGKAETTASRALVPSREATAAQSARRVSREDAVASGAWRTSVARARRPKREAEVDGIGRDYYTDPAAPASYALLTPASGRIRFGPMRQAEPQEGPADLVVLGGVVVAMDAPRTILPRGAVAVRGNRIVAVGPRDEIAQAYPAPCVIDAEGDLVMPG